MTSSEIRNKLTEKGLKITPQRMAILEAIEDLHNHPSADQIITRIHERYPNIATGTVYNILDTLADRGIILRVKSEKDIMRYDADTSRHHHLYCLESERIADYFDSDLNNLLEEYFTNKKVPGFKVEDIKLQITGRFIDHK